MSKALDKFPASFNEAGAPDPRWGRCGLHGLLRRRSHPSDRELRRTPKLNKDFAEQKEIEKNLFGLRRNHPLKA